jgi:hypothetical protein
VNRGEDPVDIVEIVSRQSNLLQIVRTLRASGGFACRLNGRQEQSHQNPNDGDHHQQFNKRETSSSSQSHGVSPTKYYEKKKKTPFLAKFRIRGEGSQTYEQAKLTSKKCQLFLWQNSANSRRFRNPWRLSRARNEFAWASPTISRLAGSQLSSRPQTHGDVREVADFEHAVMRPDVGDRLLPRLHALDEVGAVVLADRSAVHLFDRSVRQRIVLQVLDRLSGDPAAVDEEPPFVPSNRMPLSPSLVMIISTLLGMSARIVKLVATL